MISLLSSSLVAPYSKNWIILLNESRYKYLSICPVWCHTSHQRRMSRGIALCILSFTMIFKARMLDQLIRFHPSQVWGGLRLVISILYYITHASFIHDKPPTRGRVSSLSKDSIRHSRWTCRYWFRGTSSTFHCVLSSSIILRVSEPVQVLLSAFWWCSWI